MNQETISQAVTQGELTDCSEKEVLTRALGKEEYRGRTRGCGLGVAPSKYLGTKKGSCEKKDCEQCGQLLALYEGLQHKYEGLQSQMDEIRRECGLVPTATADSSLVRDSGRDSCTIPSNKVIIVCFTINKELIVGDKLQSFCL